jgi:hypothetical protein
MSEYAKDEDFVPIFIAGVYKGNPAVRTLSYEEGITSSQVAGIMTALLDCVVDSVPDNIQTSFEQEIIETFNNFIENRFNHTNKYIIKED